ERFRPELLRLEAPFRAGTFAPFFRASDNPIAMACFRLLTLPPCPDFPRRSVPRFRRRMALSTRLLAPLLYFRRDDLREDLFLAAMVPPPSGYTHKLGAWAGGNQGRVGPDMARACR